MAKGCRWITENNKIVGALTQSGERSKLFDQLNEQFGKEKAVELFAVSESDEFQEIFGGIKKQNKEILSKKDSKHLKKLLDFKIDSATIYDDNATSEILVEQLSDGEVSLHISEIWSDIKGQGSGTKLLNKLKSFSDEFYVPLSLRASTNNNIRTSGGIEQTDLVKWYEKNGFYISEEDNNFEIDETAPFMVYQPTINRVQEPTIENLLRYIANQNKTEEKLTKEQLVDLQDFSNFDREKLFNTFYDKNGLFLVSEDKLTKSGLYSAYEAGTIANDVELQDRIKDALERLKNTSDEELQLVEPGQVTKLNEFNSFGKLATVENTYNGIYWRNTGTTFNIGNDGNTYFTDNLGNLYQIKGRLLKFNGDFLIKVYKGDNLISKLDLKRDSDDNYYALEAFVKDGFQRLGIGSAMYDYASKDVKIKPSEEQFEAGKKFWKKNSQKKAEVFVQVGEEIRPKRNTETELILPITAKQTENQKVSDLNSISLEVLQNNQEETRQVLDEIENELIKDSIDIIGLSEKAIDEKLKDFIAVLDKFIKDPTTDNAKDFADKSNEYFNRDLSPKKENIDGEQNKEYVKLETTLSEEEVYNQQGLIKLDDTTYIKTAKENLTTLYENLRTHTEKYSGTLEEHVQEQLKDYNYTNAETAEAIILYKMYFGVESIKIEKGVDVGTEIENNTLPTVEETYKILEDEESRQGGSWLDTEYGENRFETEEEAMNYVKEVYNFFKDIEQDYIPIYRAVSTDENVSLYPYEIGESWSVSLDSAKEFGKRQGTQKTQIISGYVWKGNVDWESAIRLYHSFSDMFSAESEFELPIPSNNQIKNVTITSVKNAKELGKYKPENLLAPNGKKSNLNEEQWKLVRTPEFKAWSNEWKNVLLDENNEPKVYYHSSKTKDISEFKNFVSEDDFSKGGFFVTPKKGWNFAGTGIEYQLFIGYNNNKDIFDIENEDNVAEFAYKIFDDNRKNLGKIEYIDIFDIISPSNLNKTTISILKNRYLKEITEQSKNYKEKDLFDEEGEFYRKQSKEELLFEDLEKYPDNTNELSVVLNTLSGIKRRHSLYKDYLSVERNGYIIEKLGFKGAYIFESKIKNIHLYDTDRIKSATEIKGVTTEDTNDIRFLKTVTPTKQVSNFTGNYNYLTEEFPSDFYSKFLAEKKKNSKLFRNFYSNFEINEKGINLINKSETALRNIKIYADENLKQYSLISRQMPDLIEAEQSISNPRVEAMNNPQKIKENKENLYKLNDQEIIIKNETEDFVKVNNEIYESVAKQGNLNHFVKIETPASDYYAVEVKAPQTNLKLSDYNYLNESPEKFKSVKDFLKGENPEELQC